MVELNWVRNFTSKQRFLIEQVAWGRETFEGLADYFGGDPKHLKYKVIKPLLEAGLLRMTEHGGYEVDVEAVHRAFVGSGGEERLKQEVEVVEAEREEHSRELEQLGDKYEPGTIRTPPKAQVVGSDGGDLAR